MPPSPSTDPWGDRLPFLAGPRVRLRGLEPSDVQVLFELCHHPEVTRFGSRPPMQDRAEAEALLHEIHEHFRTRTLFQWGIERAADGRLLGCCTLHHLEPAHRRAEVGYVLHRECWGAGYMAEALELLLRFAFETLALHRLEADTDPRNERSLRVLERLGFSREGLLRQRYHVGGEIQDSVILGLLQPDWATRRLGGPSNRGNTEA